MKKLRKILIPIITVTILLTTLSPFAVSAADEELSAEIETVYGGAKGIVSMTFDDGNYQSALIIDDLCEKYGLEASIMMIAGNITTESSVDKWTELFSKGHLEPQSHSMTHINLSGADPENQNAQTYKTEIVDSRDKLSSLFPDYDIICYAIPHGMMSDDARALAATKYYMIRSTHDGSQTLDPGFELGAIGSWSCIRSPATAISNSEEQLTYLKDHINNAALGYWYCPITHRVGDSENSEIPYAVLEAWFGYIKEFKDSGHIWVTTASKATKYIRERQNSTATAKITNGVLSVKVTMSDTTADGLRLDNGMFDQPLTVMIELPEGYKKVSYTVGGECRIAEAFTKDNKSYAYVDVIPNSDEVILTNASQLTTPHNFVTVEKTAGNCLTPSTVGYYHCTVCNHNFDGTGKMLDSIIGELGPHDFEVVEETAATCTESGIMAHKHCTICDRYFNEQNKEIFSITVRQKKHSLDTVKGKLPTCTEEGVVEYEVCEDCGICFDEDGNELSSVTIEKKAHKAAEIPKNKKITDQSGAIAASYCSACKQYIDAQGDPLDNATLLIKNKLPIAAIAIGGAALITVGTLLAIFIIKKKKK